MAWTGPGPGRPPGGENKNKRIKAALIRYADADPVVLDKLAAQLWSMALSGDIQAMKELHDRLDGKAPQAIVGDEDHPSVVNYRDFLAWMQVLGTPIPPGHNSSATTKGANGSAKSWPTEGPEKP